LPDDCNLPVMPLHIRNDVLRAAGLGSVVKKGVPHEINFSGHQQPTRDTVRPGGNGIVANFRSRLFGNLSEPFVAPLCRTVNGYLVSGIFDNKSQRWADHSARQRSPACSVWGRALLHPSGTTEYIPCLTVLEKGFPSHHRYSCAQSKTPLSNAMRYRATVFAPRLPPDARTGFFFQANSPKSL